MKSLSAKLCGTMPGIFIVMFVCQSAFGSDLAEAVQAAVRKVEPSIVRLRVIGGGQQIDGDAVTSLVTTGIVISEDGEILTSQFAMEGNPEAVLVEDQAGKRTNATIIATDSVRRVVLLKAKEGRWTPVVPDDEPSLEVGQWSIALGRFYAAESSSISVGIISALNRIHGLAIQTDAKVSPVNYGGPLVMLNGTVSGILVPLSPRGGGTSSSGVEWYDSGIGFAIPLKEALQSAERLRAGKNLMPGRIGVQLAHAGAFDPSIVIDRVLPGGPSERAGLLKGDKILAIDDMPVERNSVLMDAIARRYAGESITLKLRRGDEDIAAAVELVEKLSPPPQGYLGLLSIRPAKQGKPPENEQQDKDADIKKQASDSVPLIIVNDSPVAEHVITSGIELASVNGTVTKSLAELAEAIEEIVPGAIAKIEYKLPGEPTLQTADIVAGNRPEKVTELSSAVLEQIQTIHSSTARGGVDSESESEEPSDKFSGEPSDPSETKPTDGVARREFDFKERGRCVVLSSAETGTIMPGVVILLSAHDTTEEEIVRNWKAVLQSHGLMVVIPKSPESARLTEVDIPLVMTSLRAAATSAGADLGRVVAVADRTQSALAWRCTFGGPSVIRGIALTDGWIADSEIQGVEGAGHSVLLLDQTQGTQAQALRELSKKSLSEAGFWVPSPSASVGADADKEQGSRCIADWTFLIRSF